LEVLEAEVARREKAREDAALAECVKARERSAARRKKQEEAEKVVADHCDIGSQDDPEEEPAPPLPFVDVSAELQESQEEPGDEFQGSQAQ
jgi:hypothetical protein